MKISKSLKSKIKKVSKLETEANQLIGEIEKELNDLGIDTEKWRFSNNTDYPNCPLPDWETGQIEAEELIAVLENEF